MASVSDDTLPMQSPPCFHLLAKPSGSTCNIDCAYCFFLSKEALYPNEKHRMSDETLEAYISQLLDSHRTPYGHSRVARRRADPDEGRVLPALRRTR